MLMCSKCNHLGATHTSCIGMTRVPKGRWYCSNCDCSSGLYEILSCEQENSIDFLLEGDDVDVVCVVGSDMQISVLRALVAKGNDVNDLLKYFNDAVIDCFTKLIRNNQNKEYQSSTHCFPPYVISLMLQVCDVTKEPQSYEYRKSFSKSMKKQLSKYDSILFPTNWNNQHWVLFEVKPKQKIIQYYDFCYKAASPAVKENKRLKALYYQQNILKYIIDERADKEKILLTSEEKEEEERKWTFVTVDLSAEQSNGYDCGAYLCVAAQHLAQNLPLDFTAKQIENRNVRRVIATSIIENVLPHIQKSVAKSDNTITNKARHINESVSDSDDDPFLITPKKRGGERKTDKTKTKKSKKE